MAIRKIKFNDTYIYVEDEIDENETGIVTYVENEKIDDTVEIEPVKIDISDDEIDLVGENNE